jgi:predicted dehydrogenase
LENDGESYLANLRIVEAIYRSHDEGRRIAIE